MEGAVQAYVSSLQYNPVSTYFKESKRPIIPLPIWKGIFGNFRILTRFKKDFTDCPIKLFSFFVLIYQPVANWSFYLLTYPLHPVGYKAIPSAWRHLALSLASTWACPQLSPMLLSSVSTLLRHVVFGLPLFLLPCGVHLSAIFGILPWSMRRTCPSHLSLLLLISVDTGTVSVVSCSSLLIFG